MVISEYKSKKSKYLRFFLRNFFIPLQPYCFVMDKLIKTNIPFRASRFLFPYAWIILIVGTIGFIMSVPGQTIGVSVFTDRLIEALGLSRVQLSVAYMGGTAMSGFIVGRAGRLYDRYGARIIAMTASACLGLVLIYLTRIGVWAKVIAGGFNLNYTIVAIVMTTFGIFALRFFGQGVLTLTSRNMVMKWFEVRRGFANGFLGIFVAFGFASAPRVFSQLIDNHGWQQTWIMIAVVVGIAFTLFAFVFFRDNPEQYGCMIDGYHTERKGANRKHVPRLKEFTLKEARNTYSFWVFNFTMAINALYITAMTFHIESVFEVAGMTKEMAVGIFIPGAIISVVFHFGASWLSDFIRLKYLLFVQHLGLIITMLAIVLLGSHEFAYKILIAGYGMCMGMFGVISAVTWPKFFGLKHLGAISGYSLGWTVIASAIGPFIFSLSEKHTGNYGMISIICLVVTVVLFILAFNANNVNRDS